MRITLKHLFDNLFTKLTTHDPPFDGMGYTWYYDVNNTSLVISNDMTSLYSTKSLRVVTQNTLKKYKLYIDSLVTDIYEKQFIKFIFITENFDVITVPYNDLLNNKKVLNKTFKFMSIKDSRLKTIIIPLINLINEVTQNGILPFSTPISINKNDIMMYEQIFNNLINSNLFIEILTRMFNYSLVDKVKCKNNTLAYDTIFYDGDVLIGQLPSTQQLPYFDAVFFEQISGCGTLYSELLTKNSDKRKVLINNINSVTEGLPITVLLMEEGLFIFKYEIYPTINVYSLTDNYTLADFYHANLYFTKLVLCKDIQAQVTFKLPRWLVDAVKTTIQNTLLSFMEV